MTTAKRQKIVFRLTFWGTMLFVVVLYFSLLFLIKKVFSIDKISSIFASIIGTPAVILSYFSARHLCRRIGLSSDETIRERLTHPKRDMSLPDLVWPQEKKWVLRLDEEGVHRPGGLMQGIGDFQTILWSEVVSCELVCCRNIMGEWAYIRARFFGRNEKMLMEFVAGSAHMPFSHLKKGESLLNHLRMRFAEREITNIERHFPTEIAASSLTSQVTRKHNDIVVETVQRISHH